MSAIVLPLQSSNDASSQPPLFESLLPSIKRVARYAFRRLRMDEREECIAEAVANAFLAFRRLVKRGLTSLVYPTALAKFAVRQVVEGRRVGSRLNVRDVLSQYAQRKKGLRVERLCEAHLRGKEAGHQCIDMRADPAELAACRIDFRDWLATLSPFKRDVALRVIAGEKTSEAALLFGVTRARISQLRRELAADWSFRQGLIGVS